MTVLGVDRQRGFLLIFLVCLHQTGEHKLREDIRLVQSQKSPFLVFWDELLPLLLVFKERGAVHTPFHFVHLAEVVFLEMFKPAFDSFEVVGLGFESRGEWRKQFSADEVDGVAIDFFKFVGPVEVEYLDHLLESKVHFPCLCLLEDVLRARVGVGSAQKGFKQSEQVLVAVDLQGLGVLGLFLKEGFDVDACDPKTAQICKF